MLDALESGSFKLIVKNRATVDAHGCVISICKLRRISVAFVVTDSVYLHIGVGFGVARSDRQGDARASECGTSNR